MERVRFAELYGERLPRTRRFLLSRGFHREDAAEMAQAAWGQAWEHLAQLRDESKILSWVNTIALNYARQSIRTSRLESSITPAHEPLSNLDEAAIDLTHIISRCNTADRAILEAQLEGVTPSEIAEQQGISPIAIRLRCFRARRAARALCEPRVPTSTFAVQNADPRMHELQKTFRENRLMFAHRHIETASTFLKLLEISTHPEQKKKLQGLIQKALDNALKSLDRLPASNGKAALAYSAVMGLRQRLRAHFESQQSPPKNSDVQSVA